MFVRKGGVLWGFVKSGFDVSKQLGPPRTAIATTQSEAHATYDKCLNFRCRTDAGRDRDVSLPGGWDISCVGTGWDFMEPLRKRLSKRAGRSHPSASLV